jgi:hypothetical protein
MDIVDLAFRRWFIRIHSDQATFLQRRDSWCTGNRPGSRMYGWIYAERPVESRVNRRRVLDFSLGEHQPVARTRGSRGNRNVEELQANRKG